MLLPKIVPVCIVWEITALGGTKACLSLICKWHGKDLGTVFPPMASSWGKSSGLAARCMIACACKPISHMHLKAMLVLSSWGIERKKCVLPYQGALHHTHSPCHSKKWSSAQPAHLLLLDFWSHVFKYIMSNACIAVEKWVHLTQMKYAPSSLIISFR